MGWGALGFSNPLEDRLNQLESNPLVAGEIIHSPADVKAFYASRKYTPAWYEEGQPTGNARQLVRELNESVASHGLWLETYHTSRLQKALSLVSPKSPVTSDNDLLFTDAYLTYASHLAFGRLYPDAVIENWFARTQPRSFAGFLGIALASQDMVQSLRSLAPSSKGYELLRKALLSYRENQKSGEWPRVPDGKKLRPGDRSRRIAMVRARIEREERDVLPAAEPSVYDEELATAVRDFQARHGLAGDGVIGGTTLAELNVSLASRIHQIEVNLERWRWLPRELGNEYLFVDIANFRADYFVGGRSRL